MLMRTLAHEETSVVLCFVDADGPRGIGSRIRYDFSMITDFERLRPLIGLCIDFGSFEQNRSLLNRSVILNHYESSWSASELRRERVPKFVPFQ
jgi:hypothetical protein